MNTRCFFDVIMNLSLILNLTKLHGKDDSYLAHSILLLGPGPGSRDAKIALELWLDQIFFSPPSNHAFNGTAWFNLTKSAAPVHSSSLVVSH